MIYRFGEFSLDRDAYSVARDGTPVHLRPKFFDVLVYLIEHRDQVVGYTELIESVWAPEPASPSAVHWTVSKIRKALGQERGSQGPIETIPRRGYRFSAEVVVDRAAPRVAVGPESTPPIPIAAEPGSDFVGREGVMAQLEEGFQAARAGAGGLYLLLGEVGIGKTRCTREFAGRRGGAASVWTGLCEYNASSPPLWPWVQILHACSPELPEGSALRAECTALLETIQSQTPERDADGGQVQAFALLDRTRSFLLATGIRPRVIVLDDLQVADATSLELLGMLVPKLGSSHLQIVATLRSPSLDRASETDPQLYDIRARARCIELPPWSRRDVAAFVAKTFTHGDEAGDSAELSEQLWRQSGGNPLFAQELARLHTPSDGGADASEIRPSVSIGLAPHGTRRDLPGTLRDVVRRRLEALPPESLAAVSAASAIGRSFSLALLQRATERPVAELLSALDAALQAGVLESGQGASDYFFRHELIRDVVYGELPGAERSRLHGRVAHALEDPAFGPVRPSILAWHFYAAAPIGHAAKAVHYAMRAARDARAVAAHADEARLCEWALEAQSFCADLDSEQRCEILVALGRARLELGDAAAGRRHLTRAIEIAESQTLPRVLAVAGAALRRSTLLAAVPDALALRALEEARRHLPEDETSLRSLVASRLACVPPYVRQPEQCEALIAEARQLARAARSRSCEIEALRATCHAASSPDDAPKLVERAVELELLAEQAGSTEAVTEGRIYRYLGLLQLGRVAEANELLTSLTHVLPRLSVPDHVWFVRHLDARRMFAAGQLDAAERAYASLHPRRQRRATELSEFQWLVGMCAIHIERGTCGEFRRVFADRTLLWRRRSLALSGLSMRMLLSEGRTAEARTELELITTEQLAKAPLVTGGLGLLALVAMAASELLDRARCEVLYERLAPYSDRHAVDRLWFSHGSVSHALGLLAEALGDASRAAEHFEVAVRDHELAGYRPHAAWSRFGAGRVALVSAHTASGGRDLLAAAASEARQMQLVALARQIESFRDGRGGRANGR